MKKYFLTALLFIAISCYSQDTTKVIILYSDTADTELEGYDEEWGTYTVMGKDQYCYWMAGYYVAKLDIYLDDERKRLPDSFIVWNRKTIK